MSLHDILYGTAEVPQVLLLTHIIISEIVGVAGWQEKPAPNTHVDSEDRTSATHFQVINIILSTIRYDLSGIYIY